MGKVEIAQTHKNAKKKKKEERKRDPKSAHHVVPDVKVFVLFLRHRVCLCVRLCVVLSLGFYARRFRYYFDAFFINFFFVCCVQFFPIFEALQNLRALLIKYQRDTDTTIWRSVFHALDHWKSTI